MTRTGIIAAAFGLAAVVVVVLAADAREMSDPRFIVAAYAVAAAILVLYTWSLFRRLRGAREDRAARGGHDT